MIVLFRSLGLEFCFIMVLFSSGYESNFILFCLQIGSNEIIGRVLVGNDRSFPQQIRAIFDDLLRSKSATATAQWLSLNDPAIQ